MQAFSSHDIFQTLYQQIMLLELKPGSTLRENGLEVVEDVMRSALGNFDQIFGTSLEEQLYGAAEGEGTASEVLSSPSPSPLPEESVADASSGLG